MGYTLNSIHAPQFPLKDKNGDGLKWFNLSNSVPSLNLSDLKGKIVLVDFWTYSCLNCQRTLPFLKKWWESYKDYGLVIIGVHSPEFEFEKDPQNVQAALKKYEVTWPVVQDNDFQIWDAYTNHYWPAKYLVNQHGSIVYNHFGEGNYIETEIQIQSALKEAGFNVPKNLVSAIDNQSGTLWKTQTPELYFGSSRGNILHLTPAQNLDADPDIIKPNVIYTTGEWTQHVEFLQHQRETADLADLIILSYKSKNVYLVMESIDNEPIKVYVTLDGISLSKERAGSDIQFDSENRAFVEVKMATIYNLISAKDFGDHILRLSTKSDKLRLFSFTFGS